MNTVEYILMKHFWTPIAQFSQVVLSKFIAAQATFRSMSTMPAKQALALSATDHPMSTYRYPQSPDEHAPSLER